MNSIWGNKDTVLKMVKTKGSDLEYASDELKNNKDIVIAAIQDDWKAFQYASDRLKNDKEVICKLFSYSGKALETLPEEMLDDPKIILASIDNRYFSKKHNFKFASSRLKADKTVVMKAINKSPFSFSYIADSLKSDQNFIKQIINQTPESYAIEYLDYNDPQYESICEKVVETNIENVTYINKKLLNNTEFIKKLINKNSYIYIYLPDNIKNNKEIVQLVLENKKEINFYYFSDTILMDKELMAYAIIKSPDNFKNIHESLKLDYEINLLYQSNFQLPISDHAKECLRNQKKDTAFYVEVYSNDFFIQCMKKINQSNIYLIASILLLDQFTPTVLIINKLKKIKNNQIQNIIDQKQNEWLAKIEDQKMHKSFASSKSDYLRIAKEDPKYFHNKKNKFITDIEFITDAIEDPIKVDRLPTELLEKPEIAIALVNKFPTLHAKLSAKIKEMAGFKEFLLKNPEIAVSGLYDIKNIQDKYGKSFLENCFSAKTESCLRYCLSFPDFAKEKLKDKPEFYQYSTLSLDDLYSIDPKILDSCFQSDREDLQMFAIFHERFFPNPFFINQFKNQKDARGLYIQGILANKKMEKLPSIKSGH